jgi:hypothetical protein
VAEAEALLKDRLPKLVRGGLSVILKVMPQGEPMARRSSGSGSDTDAEYDPTPPSAVSHRAEPRHAADSLRSRLIPGVRRTSGSQ